MKESVYKSYDELPIMLNVEMVKDVLGISLTSAHELIHEKEFPRMKVGSRIIVPKDKFREWVEKVHVDTGYGEKCPDFETVRTRKNIAAPHKFADWEIEKTERFWVSIQRNKLKQDKALVSRGAANAVKPRPAVPFGVVLKMRVWCCFGVINQCSDEC